MFAGPLGRSTFTPPKSSFDSPLYGLVSLRRSQVVCQVEQVPRVVAGLKSQRLQYTIEVVLDDASIKDTVIHGTAGSLESLPATLSASGLC